MSCVCFQVASQGQPCKVGDAVDVWEAQSWLETLVDRVRGKAVRVRDIPGRNVPLADVRLSLVWTGSSWSPSEPRTKLVYQPAVLHGDEAPAPWPGGRPVSNSHLGSRCAQCREALGGTCFTYWVQAKAACPAVSSRLSRQMLLERRLRLKHWGAALQKPHSSKGTRQVLRHQAASPRQAKAAGQTQLPLLAEPARQASSRRQGLARESLRPLQRPARLRSAS